MAARSTGRAAALVGAGIFLSRIAGLVRQRVLAHYLGLSDAADALSAAFRIPNLLQNLFGEGVLSASFIPVYARLLGEGKEDEADRVAGAIATLLGLAVAAVVALGVVAAGPLVTVLAPGFTGEKRVLTVALVRILFPGAGLLVLSAWCLGILNSHRRFFLSYAAPVAWNVVIIGTALVAGRGRAAETVVVWVAWGAVAGALAQLLVQLPTVLALARGLRLSFGHGHPGVRMAIHNFWPALAGRGANQISAYVDGVIASLLGTGAAAAVANAQLLYTLPVSLFGMSVSAAELPELSAVGGDDAARRAAIVRRIEAAQQRLAFFVVPCAAAFVTIGHVVAGAVFQTGRFSADDSRYVWAILAGSAVGLLAATLSRLTSSALYATGDTRTPMRYALVRVGLTTVLGFAVALGAPRLLGVEARWGAAGLTATAGFAAWVEFALLRRAVGRRLGTPHFAAGVLIRLWSAALAASAAGWGVLLLLGPAGPLVTAAVVLSAFAAVYGAATLAVGVPEARALLERLRRDA